jgi:hypothetical protein
MKTMQTRHEAAVAAIKDGEARGLGRKAMASRYAALFAIEDEIKSLGDWA